MAQSEEAVAVICLLSVFAMCVEKVSPRLVTACESDYRLVAVKNGPNMYDVGIWRPKPLNEADEALITLARTPGMCGASAAYKPWYTIPLDDISSRWLVGEFWGVTACFRYPATAIELEHLRRLAWL